MRARWWVGLVALCLAGALLLPAVDGAALASTARALRSDPQGLAGALALYFAAFAVRALLTSRALPGVSFGHSLAALHVALAGNKLLPLRLGEALRVTSLVRRTGVGLAEAGAATLVLRGADVLAVLGLAALLAPRVLLHGGTPSSSLLGGGARFLGAAAVWIMAALAAALVAAGLWWLRRLGHRLPAADIAAGAVAAWVLESGVLWQAAHWAGIELSLVEAVLVTAVTSAAQILAVAPGGFGTYEAAATGILVATTGAPARAALAAALTAHAVNTAYALLAGAVAAVVPTPGLLGHWRLRAPSPRPRPEVGSGHVLLVLPALDEEASVGEVVRRVPSEAAGRPVRCLVVDDGSTDRTAQVALAAGARVESFERHRGLGAGVRHGLGEGVATGAAVIAFCDADGEYAPEELERLVAPILAGEADYVVGSRFAGSIRRMPPQRRLGNRLLTWALRQAARAPITDGQSGYRAMSAAAAAEAEIVHDFNYAQVLTLDLLAKGFRYAEVPISYGFRQSGRSFVRLWRYLRHVLPAVHAELNGSSPRPAFPHGEGTLPHAGEVYR